MGKLEEVGRKVRAQLGDKARKVKRNLQISNKIGKVWKRSWKIK